MSGKLAWRRLEKRGEEINDELFDKGGTGLLSEIKECCARHRRGGRVRPRR